MKKLLGILVLMGVAMVGCAGAQEDKKAFLLDGFEGPIVTGQTIDAGAGNGSSVAVAADTAVKHGGDQSLKIDYDAVAGGYIWAARGYGLDVKGAALWTGEPDKIAWDSYGGLGFAMKGEGKGMRMAVDVKDAGGEIFRFMVTDDAADWKAVVCPFAQFFARGDWQPDNAEKNGTLDFPIKSFQFEPIAVAKGTVNVDDVSLEPLN